jgi:hypothetical protein
MKYGMFPILFFVAVPWPTSLEQFVIQGLTRIDASLMPDSQCNRDSCRAAREYHRGRFRLYGIDHAPDSILAGHAYGFAFPGGVVHLV